MSRPERGQYGNTRGKERQLRKRNSRNSQYRNRLAKEETAKHESELDALMQRQLKEPAWGVAEGARIQIEIEERHRKRLEEIEHEEPVETLVAETADEAQVIVKRKFSTATLVKDSRTDIEQFAVTTARLMLKAGYNVEHVIERTGVGWDELADLPVDSQGYGSWRTLDLSELEERDEDG